MIFPQDLSIRQFLEVLPTVSKVYGLKQTVAFIHDYRGELWEGDNLRILLKAIKDNPQVFSAYFRWYYADPDRSEEIPGSYFWYYLREHVWTQLNVAVFMRFCPDLSTVLLKEYPPTTLPHFAILLWFCPKLALALLQADLDRPDGDPEKLSVVKTREHLMCLLVPNGHLSNYGELSAELHMFAQYLGIFPEITVPGETIMTLLEMYHRRGIRIEDDELNLCYIIETHPIVAPNLLAMSNTRTIFFLAQPWIWDHPEYYQIVDDQLSRHLDLIENLEQLSKVLAYLPIEHACRLLESFWELLAQADFAEVARHVIFNSAIDAKQLLENSPRLYQLCLTKMSDINLDPTVFKDLNFMPANREGEDYITLGEADFWLLEYVFSHFNIRINDFTKLIELLTAGQAAVTARLEHASDSHRILRWRTDGIQSAWQAAVTSLLDNSATAIIDNDNDDDGNLYFILKELMQCCPATAKWVFERYEAAINGAYERVLDGSDDLHDVYLSAAAAAGDIELLTTETERVQTYWQLLAVCGHLNTEQLKTLLQKKPELITHHDQLIGFLIKAPADLTDWVVKQYLTLITDYVIPKDNVDDFALNWFLRTSIYPAKSDDPEIGALSKAVRFEVIYSVAEALKEEKPELAATMKRLAYESLTVDTILVLILSRRAHHQWHSDLATEFLKKCAQLLIICAPGKQAQLICALFELEKDKENLVFHSIFLPYIMGLSFDEFCEVTQKNESLDLTQHFSELFKFLETQRTFLHQYLLTRLLLDCLGYSRIERNDKYAQIIRQILRALGKCCDLDPQNSFPITSLILDLRAELMNAKERLGLNSADESHADNSRFAYFSIFLDASLRQLDSKLVASSYDRFFWGADAKLLTNTVDEQDNDNEPLPAMLFGDNNPSQAFSNLFKKA